MGWGPKTLKQYCESLIDPPYRVPRVLPRPSKRCSWFWTETVGLRPGRTHSVTVGV